MMAEFTVGDRVRVVKGRGCHYEEREGIVLPACNKALVTVKFSDGRELDYPPDCLLNLSPADPDQYIGKAASESELPDGTVADFNGNGIAYRGIWTNGKIHYVDAKDKATAACMCDHTYPVIRIHHLGEQRPKTLEECPDGELWSDGLFVRWHRGDGVFAFDVDEPWDIFVDPNKAKDIILADRTCLGPIAGIVMEDGKVYGKGADSRPSMGGGA